MEIFMRLPWLLCVFGLLAAGCTGGASSPVTTSPATTPAASKDAKKEKDSSPKDGPPKNRVEAENKAKEELDTKWHVKNEKVKTDPKQDGNPVVGLNLGGTDIKDADLATLKAFTHLQELDLLNTKVTDADLAQLKDLPLETLVL